MIAGSNEDEDTWDWLWKSICWEKVKIFIWIILKDRLLTNKEWARRHMTENNVCPGCQEEEEYVRHLFWDCAVAQEVWMWTHSLVDFSFPFSVTPVDWIKKN